MDKPQIFDFMDCSLFLKSHYEWRKAGDRKFSFTSWARELGFSNKTILRLFVHGKRNVSLTSSEKFRDSLQLSKLEFEYFRQLINYQQSYHPDLRSLAGKELIRLQRQRFVQEEISADVIEGFEELIPVLRTLCVFNDLTLHKRSLGELLSCSEDSIQRALNQMLASGLVKEADGAYISNLQSFHIPDRLHHEVLIRYYKYWIGRSSEALANPTNERRFRSLMFALNEEDFQVAVDRINDFAMTILSQFHSNSYAGKRLYMLNTALFPIAGSAAIDQEKESFPEVSV